MGTPLGPGFAARASKVMLAALAGASQLGCAAQKGENPSFALTVEQAEREMAAMRADPKPLVRPVIVAAGFMDPGPGAAWTASDLRKVTTTPELVIEVPFMTARTFDACRERIVSKLEAGYASGDSAETVDVDVIGVSMGGIVSRYAAMPLDGRKRLRLKRLFSIGSPHHGANLAHLGKFDARARDMAPRSEFLRVLNEGTLVLPEELRYEVFAYVRLGDTLVGEENTKYLDGRVWWVENRAFEFPHAQAFNDPRFLADIARRLRGEAAYATEPCAPLPASANRNKSN